MKTEISNRKHLLSSWVLIFSLCGFFDFPAKVEDVYSLFGKLFLSGRVEYDFTNRRDFLADTEEERVRQDEFDLGLTENRTSFRLTDELEHIAN